MSLKCVETIYHPSSNEDEEIVHPLEKSWDKVHHKHHHGYRHRVGDIAEPAPGDRVSFHPDRCGNVYRARWELRPHNTGVTKRGGASGRITNILGAPFSMRCKI